MNKKIKEYQMKMQKLKESDPKSREEHLTSRLVTAREKKEDICNKSNNENNMKGGNLEAVEKNWQLHLPKTGYRNQPGSSI